MLFAEHHVIKCCCQQGLQMIAPSAPKNCLKNTAILPCNLRIHF